MENNTVISIQNLVKQFPVGREFFTALKNITLDLRKGEFTGLVGPSGSGKTTLLNIIGGLDSSTEGKCQVYVVIYFQSYCHFDLEYKSLNNIRSFRADNLKNLNMN